MMAPGAFRTFVFCHPLGGASGRSYRSRKDESMPQHTRPIQPVPSKALLKFAAEIAGNARGPILDVPCGYGRNAAHIASLGANVVCIDSDSAALEHLLTLPD